MHSNIRQQELAQRAIDAGASIVVGHHPHTPQNVERYKSGVIMYSLGNFVFDQAFSEDTKKSLVVRLTLKGKEISVYSVWEPILPSDARFTVGRATKRIPDKRVKHFWDGDGVLAESFAPALGIQGDAWDVYLVYPRGVEWRGKSPPRPSYFMHQLQQLPASRRLNADTLAAHLQESLVKH